ncbi:hypothetical protein DFJ77DRAFT_454224 [Powellomyces hirtus]|nr:hypothetical protein DFJ77DRAFT_454224 [Powellomyces hirtus]
MLMSLCRCLILSIFVRASGQGNEHHPHLPLLSAARNTPKSQNRRVISHNTHRPAYRTLPVVCSGQAVVHCNSTGPALHRTMYITHTSAKTHHTPPKCTNSILPPKCPKVSLGGREPCSRSLFAPPTTRGHDAFFYV